MLSPPEMAFIPLSVLIYFMLISFSSLFSLLVCIYSVTKLLQLYKGFSTTDQLPSLGLRVRKWFLLGISVLNGSRCLFSAIEFILVCYITIVNKVIEDNVSDSGNSNNPHIVLIAVDLIVSYYGSSDLSFASCIVLICRVIPTIFYLACCALLIFFVFDVCFKISGYNFEAVRICWIIVNTVALIAAFDDLLIYPSPQAIYRLFIATMVVYAVALAWGTHLVYSCYAGSTGSTVASNSHHVSSPKRIIFRLACLVLLILLSLLISIVTLTLDYICLLYTSPSPRDGLLSRMPSSA